MTKQKGMWKLPETRTSGTKSGLALRYGIALLTLTAVYFVTGRFGLSFGAFSGFATLVWLPSGIATASLFLWGYRLWPGITLGAFLITRAPLFVALGIGIGNTLEAVVCAALLKRGKVRSELDSLHDVLVLVLVAAPLGALISATIGVGSLWLGGSIVWLSVSRTWSAWWLGDLISLLQLTPFLLTWNSWPQATPSSKRLSELSLLSAFVLLVGTFVFLGLPPTNEKREPITYLVFPPLTWAALRFGPRGATTALTTLSTLAIIGTVLGTSPLVTLSTGLLGERLFFLQGFMAITTITTLILAAVMAERCALEQRKDVFLSMVSHELRTPLTCLHGYTQLLQRQFAGSDYSRALHALAIMETQTKKLSRLITDLLDLSKIQAGKLTYTEETVDMDTLVGEVVEQLQPTTTRHQILIEGNTLGTIVGDRERLFQVLTNLLTNAIKYSPEAKRIIIHLASTAKSLTVGVQDFGIGIPAAEQGRVFERFYRVAGTHRQSPAGLGIGLSIAHQIIEHYEGKLWVESVEGQGSTFSFSLPRR